MKVAVVFIILLTIYSELTIAMDVTVNKNTIVKEHLLGAGCISTNKPYFMPNGSTFRATCDVSSGTHSFTIRNTAASELSYWSTDGLNCNALGNLDFTASYYQSFSIPFPSNTSSALITVTGAPCNADPCCFVIYCLSPSDCPISYDASWEDPAYEAKLAEAIQFDTIVNSVIGVVLFLSIVGCIGYCRYRRTCCFKPKLVSIPSMGDQPMRTSDGTLVVNFK